MKIRTLLLAATALATAVMVVACSGRSGNNVKLKSDTDSVAYIIGLNLAKNLMRMDSTLAVEAVCQGIYDGFRGQARLTDEAAEAYFLRYMNYTLPEKARGYEEQFLADIARRNRAYARLSSGVTYTVSEVGDQNKLPIVDRDTVTLRYTLSTIDGSTLYSSYEQGDTLRVALGDLTSGLRESLKLIGSGGKMTTWIPSREAYGAAGDASQGIAPNATLKYEIELLDVKTLTRR